MQSGKYILLGRPSLTISASVSGSLVLCPLAFFILCMNKLDAGSSVAFIQYNNTGASLKNKKCFFYLKSPVSAEEICDLFLVV